VPTKGWRAKLERSKEVLADLETEVAEFIQDKPYDVAQQIRGDAMVWELRLVKEPPVRFGVIAGEIAHDLRSALDHLAWSLVERNGQRPDRETAFPIQREQDDALLARQLRGVSDDDIAAIRELQPYQKERPDQDYLWRLHDFNRVDKHRLLQVAAVVVRHVRLTIGGRGGAGQVRLPWRGDWGRPTFDGVLGGQAIGFDETTRDLMIQIPAPNRMVRLELPLVKRRLALGVPSRLTAPRPRREANSTVDVYPDIGVLLCFADDAGNADVVELLGAFIRVTEAVIGQLDRA
jgi:hypothetical protein